MWSYYGSKKHIIDRYPPPKHDTIIEPFAGAATYSYKYWQRKIILMEKYSVVYRLWKWLQECSESDIDRLPHFMEPGDNLNNYTFECEEARFLMGFAITTGGERPRITPTYRITKDRPNRINFTLNKIRNNLHKIKHWEILHGSYHELENIKATWFIDAPYQVGGYKYPESKIDYQHLSAWCKSRKGQTIVCENMDADWLDFKPMGKSRGSRMMNNEAIWSNHATSYDNVQQSMFG